MAVAITAAAADAADTKRFALMPYLALSFCQFFLTCIVVAYGACSLGGRCSEGGADGGGGADSGEGADGGGGGGGGGADGGGGSGGADGGRNSFMARPEH